VNGLLNMCESINKQTNNDLTVDIKELKYVASIFEDLTSEATVQATKNIFMSKKKQEQNDIKPVELENLYELLDNDSIIDIRDYVTDLPGISLKETKEQVKRSTKELINVIRMIGTSEFSFHKLGKIYAILFTDNIEAAFGSVVVLDATATINEIYNQTAEHNAYWVQHIKTEDPRIYNSLTIHKAIGYKQGREAIFKKQTKDEYTNNASNYIKLARTLMTELTDKMLIITFKEFDDLINTHSTELKSSNNFGIAKLALESIKRKKVQSLRWRNSRNTFLPRD